MPSHPTRRGLLALLTLLFLFAAATPPAFAKNTYELRDDLEGDPGDGVLKPAKPAFTLVVSQTLSVTAVSADGQTWSLPVFVLPAGLPGLPSVFVLPQGAWRQAAWWVRPEDRPSGGRWHDAR